MSHSLARGSFTSDYLLTRRGPAVPTNVTCPNPSCGKSYQVSADYLGRRGRCKSCGTEFVFTATDGDLKQSGPGETSSSGPGNSSPNNSSPGNSGTGNSGASNTAVNAGTTRAGRGGGPARLGRFQILERVGMGGFGAVYRAQDPQLQRTVALKLLQSTGDKHRDKHRIDRFLIEGRAGARLQHPNIVPVFDAGKDEESGEYYLAAAFITGAPLSASVDLQPIDLRRIATIVAKLSRALDYAHGQGILHRDVKPDNVMLDEKDNPHLMDFGLARMEESESHITRDGAVMGTPSYMSPEQCIGKMDVLGPAADQYSLGCLFYELLTGQKLFEGPVSVQIHHQINTEATAPSKKNTKIPRDLDTICLKTLAKDPANRYASCAALAADLEHWLADEPIQARQLTSWERWERWRKKNPAIAGLSMGLAAALVIGLLGITTQWLRAESNAHAARLAAEEQRKAKEIAVKAEQAAVKSEKAAIAAERAATADRHATQISLAESYVQRGRFLCLRNEVAQGLLWMARGMRALPPGQAAAEALIARRIGAWEPLIPKRQLLVRHNKPVAAAKFEPQGKWFVTASRDNTARIWDTATGQPLTPPLQHDREVISVDISDDGRRVLTAGFDGTARQWQVVDGKPIGKPIKLSNMLNAAVYADGGRIATRGFNKELQFWDMDTGEPRSAPIPLKSPGRLIATHDRRTLLVVDSGDVIAFDTSGQEIGPRMPYPSNWDSRGIAAKPDGQAIVIAGITGTSRKATLRSWEFTGQRKQLQSAQEAPWTAITDVQFSPDGKWLVTGSLSSFIERRSAEDFKRVGVSWDAAQAVRTVAYHPDGERVLTAGDDMIATIWSLPRPQPERLVIQHPPGVYSVNYSPDGQRLVSAGKDGTLRIWNAETGAAIGPALQHQGTTAFVVFSPDGKSVASAGGNTAQIWTTHDGMVTGPPLQHPHTTMGVHFSPDGKTLVTACEDGIARLWDVDTRKIIAQTAKHPAKMWPAEFSSDGKLIATGSGTDVGQSYGEVHIWDGTSGKLVAGPMPHLSMIWTVRFGHQNQWIATAADRSARVWDIKTSKVVRGPFLHPSGVDCAIFDPSESMLVTSCGDGRIRFWDLDSQQQFGPDLTHDDMVVGLSFTPDGRRLASGSMDGTVRIWDVPQPATGKPDQIERRIQRATGLRVSERGNLENIDAETWLKLDAEVKSK